MDRADTMSTMQLFVATVLDDWNLSGILAGAQECLKDADEAHGLDHAIRVAYHAMCAYEKTDWDLCMMVVAALLHDVDDRKVSPQTTETLQNATTILQSCNFPDVHIGTILDTIREISFSSNGTSATNNKIAQYVKLADQYEAIGDIGNRRCLSYTQHTGHPYFTPNTPRPQTRDELRRISAACLRNYMCKKSSDSYVDHYYDKLYHIASQEITIEYFEQKFAIEREKMEQFLLAFGNATNDEHRMTTIRDFIGNSV